MAKHQSRTDFSKLPNFPGSFQSKYLIGKRKTRTYKFTPKILFHTVLELVAGKNREGYIDALLKSFDFNGKKGVQNEKPINVLDTEYFKPNFKVVLNFTVGLLSRIFQGYRRVLHKLHIVLKLCTERRKRHSRSYKRELMTSASPYSYNNTVWVH
jgi:hypothetical protein